MQNEIQTEVETQAKTTHCLNCGTEFQGSYCPECGQSAETGRFTLQFIWYNLLAAVLGRDGGIGYTIKNLFTRPGSMIVEILNGKRRKYVSPFPTLFLSLTIYVLVFTITGSKEITPQNIEIKASETADNSELFIQKANQLVYKGYHFYLNHYTLCYMLTLPLFFFSARACYGKQNRERYYRGEYIVTIVYAMAMLVTYRCVINLIYPFSSSIYEDMAFIEPIAVIIALTACFRKMMGFSTIKTIWRSTLTIALYYAMLGFVFILVIFSLALFFGLKYLK